MYRTLFYGRLPLWATSGLCPFIISWPSVCCPDSCPGATSLPSSHQRALISIQYYLSLRLQIPINQPSFNYSHCWITLTREMARLARQRVLPTLQPYLSHSPTQFHSLIHKYSVHPEDKCRTYSSPGPRGPVSSSVCSHRQRRHSVDLSLKWCWSENWDSMINHITLQLLEFPNTFQIGM